MSPACDGVNVRTSASLSASIRTRLALSARVGVQGTVAGSAWSAVCPTARSGNTWFRIVSINGASVSSLYGVPYLYAATGVLALPANITAVGANVTFFGRGWGHGVGMSQWGARGRALAGQTDEQILAHYYAGTAIGTVGAGTPVRVLLLDETAPAAASPLTIWGRGGGWSVSGVGTVFPAEARLRVAPAADGILHLIVDTAAGVLLDTPAPADFRLTAATASTVFEVGGKPAAYDRYRGALRVVSTSGSTFDVVNELSLEAYLAGVVPAEMPSTWPAEALKAQAVAARSYAAAHLHPASGTFDLYDDTRSQVYLGIGGETGQGTAAIAATANQVLLAGGSIANAMFHSTGGGATENNEFAFTSPSGGIAAGPVSYLRGSSDRDANGASYDAASPYASWQTKTYTVAALSSILAADARTNVGTLQGLGLTYRGVSGRLVAVTIVGSAGTKTVSGNVFVAVFNASKPATDPQGIQA
jgi:SpoIID/LytB domain protein